MSLRDILPDGWKLKVAGWLEEDTPSFDYGGYVVGSNPKECILYCKSPGTLAGVPFFDEVFRRCDCKVEWSYAEGTEFNGTKTAVAKVTGPANKLLLGERPALNMLARASGVATITKKIANVKCSTGWKGVVACTRKTTPGFRIVEKYACLVGGGDTHRMDLSTMIMLKDNHIWALGSITKAVQQARSVGGFSLKIEVECRSEEEADEAINAGADIIMLDNFTGKEIGPASASIKTRHKGKSFLIEASGGLTVNNCQDYMVPDVDILSFGSITQSVEHVDFSLKVAH